MVYIVYVAFVYRVIFFEIYARKKEKKKGKKNGEKFIPSSKLVSFRRKHHFDSPDIFVY